MICFGNVPAGSVLPIFFDAFSGSTGASITISGLAVTDIEVYKGTSMTQRASDNGYALIDTDGIDLDGITGIHGFSIDLSDNSDASFYAAGSFYTVVVSAVTIDSQTVSFIAATFRIVAAENTAGTSVVDVGRINNVSTSSVTTINAHQGTTAANTAQTGDNYARLGAPVGASISADIAGVQSDTNDIQTRLPAALDANGFMKADVEDWKGATAPAMTGDAYARLGAPSGASVSADIAANLAALLVIDDYVDTEVAAIYAVCVSALTESYAANGVAPTLTQAIMAIHQHLMEFAISGTSYTVKKLDSATTAYVATLDDGTSPTSMTR